MTPKPPRLSRRTFVENSALAFGLLGSLAATKGYGASTASPSSVSAANQVNARQYGAKGDGNTNDAKALQAALDAAQAGGPICCLPAGLYRLNGPLTVPPGVTLCGASGGVPHSEHPIGTVLLAYGGRGQPEGEPLVTLKANAVVRNLIIHYPEQTLADVAPYPWSIRADGELCQILDVTLTNPYQAIDVGTKWNEAGVQFANGQFMSTVEIGPENRGPVKFSNCGFWGTELTREQVRHEGGSSLVLTSCHFTGWDHGGKGDPCIRASGRHLIVNGCEFMDERKRAIILEKGLKAATVLGCTFRGQNAVEDQSGADVKTGLNTNA